MFVIIQCLENIVEKREQTFINCVQENWAVPVLLGECVLSNYSTFTLIQKTRGGFFSVKQHVYMNEYAHLLWKMVIFIQINMPFYTKKSASGFLNKDAHLLKKTVLYIHINMPFYTKKSASAGVVSS